MPIKLTSRQQLALGLVLGLTMILTRPHSFNSLHHLPGTSWAVFFLAGLFIQRAGLFFAYCGLAAAIDYAAITYAGVSNYCVTPAYAMLLPAYGALWLGGRWYARAHADAVATLPRLALAVAGAALVAELFSSGGFYFLGGRFAEPTLAEFSARLVRYFPHNLGTLAMYVTTAAVVYAAWAVWLRADPEVLGTGQDSLHK
ncbi:MAG: hypothetical protein KF778_03675 [Rhodocyclaceae bacterium]|nr:hypothetical protein [Rhodocyclaceae bacterium]MBX3667478.1 hypothetical protein [Rhodocyclaceae bacterium]